MTTASNAIRAITASFKAQAQQKTDKAAQWKARLIDLKQRNPCNPVKEAKPQDRYQILSKEARELTAKTQEFEDAVYDLKAVNSNAKANQDTRTPLELLDLIATKGCEVMATLDRLWM